MSNPIENINEIPNYSADVFSLKKHVGAEFVQNFITTYELQELQKKIEEVTKTSKEKSNRTPILAFCSEKGGSGKTTTALCVSQVVANLGFKVLVLDVDPSRGSSPVINNRKALMNAEIQEAEEQNIPVESVLDYKYNSEPVIDAMEVLPSNFNASFLQELAEKKDYDLIVVDTAGVKLDEVGNFDIRQISATGRPHLTSAYVSNLVVIPTATSNLDLNKMIAFTQPLMVFIGTMDSLKRNFVKTQYRVLANRVERQGSGLKELAEAKEEVPFNWFETSVRRSEKIAANVSTKHTHTVFSNNTVKQINIAFMDLTSEIYNNIEASLEF
jgi:cellulose biosynthesis protein BcsQ